ncbi:uncharacterized protein CC84DRAFT_158800 [Paraphaeosphaeria sporulosa]|uniref:Uncharacterized protein n=1 Tax=Paraphaeosphaeria sporulosa TaxID=1460663 RepID=A0A177CZQ2_9PLEO|nr:uncharacterized protein CC84DRAFT_158800 [Paraphaeosphaeria sporulosa]OAG12786.1 hypothetical protein CC84DRAFT_158800 [Paraphaeosphaeria sporulosa]
MRTGGQPRHSPCVSKRRVLLLSAVILASKTLPAPIQISDPGEPAVPFAVPRLGNASQRSSARTLPSCAVFSTHRFVLSFRVACVRSSAQLCDGLPRDRTSRSTAHEDPTSGSVGARQCALNATGRPCPEGCPWPQRPPSFDDAGRRRQARSAAEDESPKDAPVHALRRLVGQHSPQRLLARDVSSSAATPRRRRGRRTSLECSRPRRDASVPKFGCPTARLVALGCPAQTSQLELSRTARARLGLTASPSSVAVGPLSNLRLGEKFSR